MRKRIEPVALDIADRATANGFAFRYLAAGEEYGHAGQFRRGAAAP